jgi:hypothetical protein
MVFYYDMIYSPETIIKVRYLIMFTFTIYNGAKTAVSQRYILCA